MALFRSVTVGLLGACLYFVVQLAGAGPEAPVHAPAAVAQIQPAELAQIPITVIDVARGVSATTIPSLVHVEPGERIASVDDRPVASDLVAGAMILERSRGGGFVDLTIESPTTARRVLVLMH